MKNKLTAIWWILFADHYLITTGRGNWIGVTPRNLEHLQLMSDLGNKLKKVKEEMAAKESK